MSNPRHEQIETYISQLLKLAPPRGKECGEFVAALMILAGRLINEEDKTGVKSKLSIGLVVNSAIRLFTRAALS